MPSPRPQSPADPATRPWDLPIAWVALIGNRVLHAVAGFGRFARFFVAVMAGIPHLRAWARRDRIARQLYFVGTTSVPVLMLTGGFIGMILAFEGFRQFQSIGQEGRLGGVINLSMVKQIGPVLAAVMLAGRVGCALTAELGTMRVTEQLDAMRAMASDPIRVLVVPRVLACVLMIPILTIFSNLCGVLGGWLVTVRFYDADPAIYLRFSELLVSWFDVANGLIKSIFFGLGIGLISCYKGFTCKPGAEGVGQATTDSFVTSFICIIAMSLVLAKVLNDLDFIIHGGIDSVFR